MNPTPHLQTVGNICVGFAALIYALPLQYLLLELSRKKDDGGGVLAGIILLLPMWLLLLGALLCVTAGGGLDSLRLSRTVINTLVVLAALSMTALSFMCFEFPRHPSFTTRLIGRLPVYLFPAATMLLVILSLNPRLAPGFPLPPVKLTWLVCAGLSLALCGGLLGYRFVVSGTSHVTSLFSRLAKRGVSDQEILATISTLDPQRDFTDLLKRTGEFESRAVREAALTRLRSNPNFVANLATELKSGSPEPALAAVEYATFTPEEQKLLAPPARTAIERIVRETRKEFRYIPKDRRKSMRRWGNRLFTSIAGKFEGAGVDFQPALGAFEETFTRPEEDFR